MKTIMSAELPGLPGEVRALIADGVYSLYELPTDEPRYVLLTTQRNEFYFLSEQGNLVSAPSSVRSIEDLKLGAPVTVVGERATPRVNVG